MKEHPHLMSPVSFGRSGTWIRSNFFIGLVSLRFYVKLRVCENAGKKNLSVCLCFMRDLCAVEDAGGVRFGIGLRQGEIDWSTISGRTVNRADVKSAVTGVFCTILY